MSGWREGAAVAAVAGDGALRLDPSWTERLLDAWSDMRWSTRSFLHAAPSEGRVLLLALVSDFGFFLARALSMAVAPPAEIAGRLPERVGLLVLLAFLARTLVICLAAAAARLVALPFGGSGGWRETRAAAVWASVVAAPVELLAAAFLLAAFLLPGALPEGLVRTALLVGPIAFGYLFCAAIAEAQGFRRVWPAMAVAALLAAPFLWGAALVLSR